MFFYKNTAKLAMAVCLLFFSTSHAASAKKPTKKEFSLTKNPSLRSKKKISTPTPAPQVEIAPVPMDSFPEVFALLERRRAELLVATGGEPLAHSADIFENWADAHDAIFVCLNERTLKTVSQERLETVKETSSEETFTIPDPIDIHLDFLYLGSQDYDQNDPLPFQKHYLQELIDNYNPYFSAKAVVMIDGCDLPGGGPGNLVLEYLLQRDWEIFSEGSQIILIRL